MSLKKEVSENEKFIKNNNDIENLIQLYIHKYLRVTEQLIQIGWRPHTDLEFRATDSHLRYKSIWAS